MLEWHQRLTHPDGGGSSDLATTLAVVVVMSLTNAGRTALLEEKGGRGIFEIRTMHEAAAQGDGVIGEETQLALTVSLKGLQCISHKPTPACSAAVGSPLESAP